MYLTCILLCLCTVFFVLSEFGIPARAYDKMSLCDCSEHRYCNNEPVLGNQCTLRRANLNGNTNQGYSNPNGGVFFASIPDQ